MTGPLSDVELHLVDNIDEAWALFRWLGTVKRQTLGVDTETTGLSLETDRVRLVQVGDENTGWAIPWDRWGGVFEDVLKRWERGYVLHNAPYDVGMLDKESVHVPRDRVRDTRPMTHIINPDKSTALKNVAGRLVDPVAPVLAAELDAAVGKTGGWSWATIPIHYRPYWSYGALDPVLTCRIEDVLWPQVQSDAPRAYELENAVLWPIFDMERYGAHVDRTYAREQLVEFVRVCDEVRDWCRAEYGLAPGSNPPVIAYLQSQGYPFTKRTASGALCLDKEVLSLIDHPLAEAVLRYRQHQKMASTYLQHFVNEPDGADLLHPSINTLGARTSRMSMSDPNLQNLPRRNEGRPEATAIRNCVTTRYEDGVLIMCDFDQIEMRGLAHISQDPGMIAAFRQTDVDFFVALGRAIFSDPTMQKSDQRRQLVKNGGYAKIYGAGLAKFSKTAGVTQDVGRAFLQRFDEMYPGGRNLAGSVERLSKERLISEGSAYVRSPITGRRHTADPGHEYALVNYMIQGMAAEIFKMKILELDAAGLGRFMVVPVHDEIMLDVPREHVPAVVNTLHKVMNDDSLLSVPISASASYGKRWGEKRDWTGEGEWWR